MPGFDHFDFIAPIYEKAIRPTDAQRWLRLANLPASGRLLDVGGGTGRVANALCAYIDQVFIADLSAGMLLQAHQKPCLETICSPSERLPFADACFERVIMVDAFHHIINGKQTAAELWRVLKPGGRLVIEEPDIRHGGVKLVALGEKIALMRSHFVPPPRISALFNSPKARRAIFRDGTTAWVMVDKLL